MKYLNVRHHDNLTRKKIQYLLNDENIKSKGIFCSKSKVEKFSIEEMKFQIILSC